MLGLLHAQVQPRQHGHGQNDPVPVDAMAHMDGHRIDVQLPVSKEAGEADRHVFHCDHNRFFLSAAGIVPPDMFSCKRLRCRFLPLPRASGLRHDAADRHPFRRDVCLQKRGDVLRGDGIEHLRELEGIIAVEIPLRQGDGNILKGVQRLAPKEALRIRWK